MEHEETAGPEHKEIDEEVDEEVVSVTVEQNRGEQRIKSKVGSCLDVDL